MFVGLRPPHERINFAECLNDSYSKSVTKRWRDNRKETSKVAIGDQRRRKKTK